MTKSMVENGTQKRTYNIAIVCTPQYYEFNSNPTASQSDRIAQTIAKVTNDMNVVNAVYNRELAVHFNVLTPVVYVNNQTSSAGTGIYTFTPVSPPPFPGAPIPQPDALLKGAEAIEAHFGSDDPNEDYDLGHVFNTDNAQGFPFWQRVGAAAAVQGLCNDGSVIDGNGQPLGNGTAKIKALGWSGWWDNVEQQWLKVLMHEIGHQMGATHSLMGMGI